MGNSVQEDLISGIVEKDPQKVSKALSQGADPNGSHGVTPLLHVAALSGSRETVELLIKSGADVDRSNERGWTALHCAAMCVGGDPAGVAQALLNAGADANANANAKHRGRKTPLDFAAWGNSKTVGALIYQAGGTCQKRYSSWARGLGSVSNRPEGRGR